MRRLIVVALFSLAHATAALAQTAPATPATPPAAPPADAAPVDALKEPRDIVETGSNTKENLKKAIGLYEAALPAADAKAKCAGYADVGRAWLRLGDLETVSDAKIAAYSKGREAAQKGIAADGKCAEAIYWDMANQAVIGRTRGVMNSLFMLGDLRKGLNQVLAIDPNHKRAKHTLAKIDHAVPGLAGGSDERAEKSFKELLARDPHWTPAMVSYAEFLRDNGKKDDARAIASKCVAESASTAPNDFRKFDKRDCEAVLKELGE